MSIPTDSNFYPSNSLQGRNNTLSGAGPLRRIVGGDIQDFDGNNMTETSLYDVYFITSAKAKSGTTNSFTVFNPFFQNVKQFKLLKIEIPRSFYNITGGSITFGALGAVNFTAGYYTLTSLITFLNTISPNLTFSLNNYTQALQVVSTTATAYAVTDNGGGNAGQAIGVSTGFTIAGNATTQFPQILNLCYPSAIYMKSMALTRYDTKIRSNCGITDLIEIIPLAGTSFGSLIVYEPRTVYQINNKFVTDIDFTFVDQNDTPLNFLPNSPDIRVSIEYYRTPELIQTK